MTSEKIADETTPLTEDLVPLAEDIVTQADNKESAEAIVKMASENATALTEIVMNNIDADKAKEIAGEALDRMKELSQRAIDGDLSIRLCAIISAIFVLATSGLDIFGRLLTLHLVTAVLDVYTAVFSLIVICIETNENDCISFGGFIVKNTHAFLAKNFQIFDYVTGRGAFYLFIGTLKLIEPGLLGFLSGVFMTITGVMYCYFGYRASQMMRASQEEIGSEEDLKSLFDKTDKDESGTIELDEFICLVQVLGLKLNKREIELAFMIMDKDHTQKIHYEEFKEFWDRSKISDSQRNFLV